jgi:hypothetical protein
VVGQVRGRSAQSEVCPAQSKVWSAKSEVW